MKTRLLVGLLSLGLLFTTATPSFAITHYRTRQYEYHYRTRQQYVRHKRHMKTAKRVGIGAAGGAVIGALAGGKKGALIGATAGAGAGALYYRHNKRHAYSYRKPS